jgi:hypothetical protein
MRSDITLTITLEHDEPLDMSAQGLAFLVANAVAREVRVQGTTTQWGRVSRIGPEDGKSVAVFLQSAFLNFTSSRTPITLGKAEDA